MATAAVVTFCLLLGASVVTDAAVDCPYGWTSSEESSTCVKLSTDSLNWTDARIACQGQGGDLVRIINRNMALFIGDLIGGADNGRDSSYWIGLHDDGYEDIFVWLDDEGETEYTHWDNGQPNDYGSGQDCVVAGSDSRSLDEWSDLSCLEEHKYICEVNTKVYRDIDCPYTWTKSYESETCIQLYAEELSWSNSRAACQNLGGDLVKIINEAMNGLISDIIEGLNHDYPHKWWIGLNRGSSGTFYWLDETDTATYDAALPWAMNQPDTGDCVLTNFDLLDAHQWGTDDCGAAYYYICEIPPKHYQTLNCPDGWFKNYDSNTCLLLYTDDRLTWENARAHCQDDQGDMVRITGPEVNQLIADEILKEDDPSYTVHYYWIGLHDDAEEGVFVWLDDTKETNYTSWYNGQPDNRDTTDGTGQDCVVTGYSSAALNTWGDFDCSEEHNMVCEKAGLHFPPIECPDGLNASLPSGSCLKLFQEALSWSDARAACQAGGGDLIKVDSSSTNELVAGLIEDLHQDVSNTYWIGLVYEANMNIFVWLDESEEASFVNWANGQPSNYKDTDDQDCGLIAWSVFDFGSWGDANAGDKHYYICEYPPLADSSSSSAFSGMSAGATAAAVLIPLIVIGLIPAAYFGYKYFKTHDVKSVMPTLPAFSFSNPNQGSTRLQETA